MTTRVLIRNPFASHLAVQVLQRNPTTDLLADATVAAVLDHGRRFEGYVHSGSEFIVRETPRPEGGAPTYQLSRGEKLAGVSFNPSGDARVSEAKDGYADRINEVLAMYPSATPDQRMFLDAAMQHLLAAQMLVVKAITWKP